MSDISVYVLFQQNLSDNDLHEYTLHAPGIGDDTSNLVNLMMAAKYLLKNQMKMKCGALLVANSCEEGLGNLDGTKALFAKYGSRIRAFYSFDGYIPQCTSNAVGSYRYMITCKTVGGHSYLDFGKPNAIEILCRLVEKLYRIQPPSEEKTTYNVGRIEGGTTVNSLPQEASLLYEFRSTSQRCLEIMEQKFSQTLEGFQSCGGTLSVDVLGIRPGNGPVNQTALKKFTAHSADVISSYYAGELDFSPYSTDSNIPLSLGILANTIGTVRGSGAHTREEWIDKHSLKEGLEIALSIMLSQAENM
ncbi:MAG: M20/M25/M40 family metallo-hydrolase [Oscillospiraceae bacterium]|nr:M20/M25/M40 family metallo-hydrolase [Oscillospiraceae bacterium]